MRITSTLLFSFTISALPAQITIGPADMPSEGDSLHFRTTQSMDIDLATTGAGVTWDMSALVPMDDGVNVAVSVGSTPILYQFYFNNGILYPDHQASFAMEGASFDFQLLTIEDVFDYFKNDASGYRNVGFGAMVNGIPTSVRRQPVDVIHEFPMQFGDTDSSFSAWNVEVPGTFFFDQQQWRHNEVDGWGTLILPADTFEVLRVRSVLNRHDSIHVDQFGIGFGFDEPETVEYKWLANGMGRPVLSVTTVADIPTLIEFHYDEDEIITSVPSRSDRELIIHPNPAQNSIGFQLEGVNSIQITDIAGRIWPIEPQRAADRWIVPVEALPNGTYTMRIEGDRTSHGRFIVVR